MKTISQKQLKALAANVEADKELSKNMRKMSHFDSEVFVQNALRYIDAVRTGRMMCNIKSVSRSGMSRTIKFFELDKNKYTGRHQVMNFYGLFTTLGYRRTKDGDAFTIGGCGMDMVFHTNYTIIRTLARLGFIAGGEDKMLEQMTPHVI